MQIEFDKMTGNKKVYEYMWRDSQRIPGKITKTYFKKKESNDSYSFEIPFLSKKYKTKTSSEYLSTAKKISKEDIKAIAEQLITNFEIVDEEKDVFMNKLIDACAGDGHEGVNITRLHASSLCAFLFFYNVSNHPLKLSINGNDIIFNEVLFEYQNTVIPSRRPSNVDIVLISKDKGIILFLESKFSEYLKSGQANVASEYKEKYPNIYNPKFLDSFGFEFKKNEEEKVYKIGPQRESVYSEGIKQMISHYIGIENYLKLSRCDKRLLPKAKIYLGEIVFDFAFDKAQYSFKKYTVSYNKLAKELNKLNKNIQVLKEPFKYSLFKTNDFINPQIRKFYFG